MKKLEHEELADLLIEFDPQVVGKAIAIVTRKDESWHDEVMNAAHTERQDDWIKEGLENLGSDEIQDWIGDSHFYSIQGDVECINYFLDEEGPEFIEEMIAEWKKVRRV